MRKGQSQRAFNRANDPVAGKFSVATLWSASRRPARIFLGARLGKLRHGMALRLPTRRYHPPLCCAFWVRPLCYQPARERLARVRGQGTARINGQERGGRLPGWRGELGKEGARKVLGNARVNETERVKRGHHCQHRAGTAFSQDGKAGDGQGTGSTLPSSRASPLCSVLPVLIPEDWKPYGCTVTPWLGKSTPLPQIPSRP